VAAYLVVEEASWVEVEEASWVEVEAELEVLLGLQIK
jgi:hypothetical protein